ncbi:hypothetical protein MPH_01104 [Macrophomina phaseolina MS6]|uniref:Uncharacterized protein n=1 Tax=Macrophomina phaseolina (strain MS6) TaxID=1126212 RepID=K2RGE0_MACPH|nr:hypothetical protein MPH_01104 [Macrophomina phaseolina MS6]
MVKRTDFAFHHTAAFFHLRRRMKKGHKLGHVGGKRHPLGVYVPQNQHHCTLSGLRWTPVMIIALFASDWFNAPGHSEEVVRILAGNTRAKLSTGIMRGTRP